MNIAPLLEIPMAKTWMALPPATTQDKNLIPRLRGQLGFALKQRFCPFNDFKTRDCRPCPDMGHCPYTKLFSPASPTGATPPRPYALGLVPAPTGEPPTLELTLVGTTAIGARSAMEKALARAVAQLGPQPPKPPRPHPFETRNPAPSLAPDLSQWTAALPPLEGPLTEFTLTAPIQLKRQGHDLTFPALVKTILARLRDLKRAHHPVDRHMGDVPPAFYQAARAIPLFSHLGRTRQGFTRRGRTLDLGGLEGSFVLKGDLTPFSPLLAAAFLLGLGQKTVYGLGRFTTPAWETALTQGKKPEMVA